MVEVSSRDFKHFAILRRTSVCQRYREVHDRVVGSAWGWYSSWKSFVMPFPSVMSAAGSNTDEPPTVLIRYSGHFRMATRYTAVFVSELCLELVPPEDSNGCFCWSNDNVNSNYLLKPKWHNNESIFDDCFLVNSLSAYKHWQAIFRPHRYKHFYFRSHKALKSHGFSTSCSWSV